MTAGKHLQTFGCEPFISEEIGKNYGNCIKYENRKHKCDIYDICRIQLHIGGIRDKIDGYTHIMPI